MSTAQFFCMGASGTNFKVLNDPTHVCKLPDAAAHPLGTHIQCTAVIVGGAHTGGHCGRTYTRSQTWWKRTPYWADYDYGW